MKLEEIKAYLDENKDNAEVKAFVQGLNPITKDRVETFVRTDKEGMSWLDSLKDKHFEKALETWKTNNLQKLIDDKVKELYPEEDPKDTELKKLLKEIENMKADTLRKELTNKAIKTMTEKSLPIELVDLFVGTDEDSTVNNIESLEKVFTAHVTKLVEEKLAGGYKPPKQNTNYQGVNPWAKETLNLTEQAKILKENPALATQLKESANK